MDFYVVLTRAGRRVILRRRCRSTMGEISNFKFILFSSKINKGNNQKVSTEEAQEWFRKKYEGLLIN